MSSADPDDDTPPSRKPWIWLSVVLTAVAAGLLFWALTIRSDLDSTQQELDSTQEALAGSREELDKTKQELDAAKQEVEQLQSEGDGGIRTGAALLGAKAVYNEFAKQLDATHEDLAATQTDLEEAEKAAAKAYISAFGGLFEGDTARDQAPAVREQLSAITATCKDELAGA